MRRRCAVSSAPSALSAAPPASVLSGSERGLAERMACSGLTPCAARRWRSPSVSTRVGRVPRRSSSSSSGPAAQGGRCSSSRASVPATAPQLAKTSGRPRRRSKATTRGKHISACSERKSSSRSPCSGVVAGVPGRRRVHDQHRATLAAQARRHHQGAGADVAVAGQRRYADEVHVLDRRQREQARARLGRADHVVVGERRAVVAVRVRVHVADRVSRAVAERLVRARRRHGAPDARPDPIPAARPPT